MKAIVFSLMMVVGLVFNAQAQEGSEPVITFTAETHDFGDIPQGKPVTVEFKFKNTGKTDLILDNVKPSCGCTTPEWSKEPIAPGATGIIKATYNAANAGPFNKAITITSNATEGTKRIFIKGSVAAAPVAPANDGVPTKKPSIVNQ
ncbi:hypothetical protein BH09BAC1_BH09BAC1_02190 [soil metagenome]